MGISLEKFVSKVAAAVSKRFGEEKIVDITETEKNNGVVLHGIVITEPGKGVSPAIYLDSFYREYEQGKTFAAIMREILELYESTKTSGRFDAEKFLDFNRSESRIVYKLVNYERNRKYLEKVPFIRFLDLAIVFYYMVEESEYGNAVIQIRNEHLSRWHVGKEEVFRRAQQNTPRQLPFEIRRMSDLLREMTEMQVRGNLEEIADFKQFQTDEVEDGLVQDILKQMELTEGADGEECLYVLTNSQKNMGAACILYPEILKNFSAMVGRDFYVLPSSIHEVLLLPVQRDIEPQRLKRMVQEINESELETEELLSDNVYYFNRQRGKLEIC